ncbi:MAG: ABC transporter ATP-binding protein [Clostridia bacterium]|jgi:ABC-2 type transport system ATP-binding protein|nr:ABC transporter ATP-binding protein [Clostridia bacterium]
MIVVNGVSKSFGDILAVDNITLDIKKGSVFGLIGTNGAGKSTLLRLLCGILAEDAGTVTIDGERVFENIAIKERCFYISDNQYFFSNCTPNDMRNYYADIYRKFDKNRFDSLLQSFGLNPKRKINTFSKGMKKQVSVICAVSAMTDYIFCDETFDGLDPVMRQAVKSIFAGDIADREMTPIIASHNLRELEDICDHIGLLHKGGMLLSHDLEDMKLGIHKIQAVFNEEITRESFPSLEIISLDKRGSLYTIVVRGQEKEAAAALNSKNPVFMEILPLTLEEIFISETEVTGYDIKSLIV